ncbi:hypothetical protein CPB84DRAFT_1851490 [Gymnopilus junonius]|uniref:Uncharacterized protein n=1 Tax=Gymnopilus junonius TaxID=109634 RepID=A0A9P5TJ71_GYMJU|nr:hypothetical protein CPB84DRAFT_1851490 [Gymnopilus junonius]
MPDAINVDDTDPSIVYSGSWQVLTNNPLEFGGGVHSTTQAGASATITVKGTFIGSFLVYHLLNRQVSPGTRLQMFCTVANGTGNETANFIFDGRTGPSLIRSSHADMSYYKDGWFDSGPVLDIDYFAVNGSVVLPSGTPTSSGNSALTTSTGSTSTSPSGDSTTHFTVNTSISSAEKTPHLFSVSPPPQLSSSSSLPPSAPLDTETDSLSYQLHHLSDSPLHTKLEGD